PAAVVASQNGVHPRAQGVRQRDVAIRAAADERFARGIEREVRARSPARENGEVGVHADEGNLRESVERMAGARRGRAPSVNPTERKRRGKRTARRAPGAAMRRVEGGAAAAFTSGADPYDANLASLDPVLLSRQLRTLASGLRGGGRQGAWRRAGRVKMGLR